MKQLKNTWNGFKKLPVEYKVMMYLWIIVVIIVASIYLIDSDWEILLLAVFSILLCTGYFLFLKRTTKNFKKFSKVTDERLHLLKHQTSYITLRIVYGVCGGISGFLLGKFYGQGGVILTEQTRIELSVAITLLTLCFISMLMYKLIYFIMKKRH